MTRLTRAVFIVCLSLMPLLCRGKAPRAKASDLAQLQVGNLIYGKQQSSVCFADRFLKTIRETTHLEVGNSFVPVDLSSPDLFDLPFCIFSGEGSFNLSEQERENLRTYLKSGGFILASPSCSNADWDRSLRREIALCLPEEELAQIPMSHPIFSMINQIDKLVDKKGKPVFLQGMHINGRLVMVYSVEGLNDVKNAKGCCCCGGNEIRNPALVNVNIFTYATIY
ncbi:DUF4159 domain-containing protein [Coraliomargarita parva]|uniref:DUF4159 domain-containing protein n=1 Tax=Coraliomargarita parva TaxID=3014050 RepID=UPI0022B51065|nr:DUF4159 domain-containing protein [Coraliomargarita parva]